MCGRSAIVSHARIDQPEPWIALALALKCAWNFSKPPKYSVIAAATSPSGWPPPSGLMFFQNTEWLV